MLKNSPAQKLNASLVKLKNLVNELDLESQVYREGTTVGQIAFHTSQAANFWLKVRLLGGKFERDKDTEMTTTHTLDEINNSIDLAISAVTEFGSKDLDLNEKLSEVVTMGDYEVDSIGSALIFLSSHTGEHVAEITMVRDYVSTLKS